MNTQLRMKSTITSENVARYVVEKIVKESDIERNLRLETSHLSQANMISGSDVGSLLSLLAQSVNAKNAIEVGTFTGYTALKVASILPASGKLVCCDISSEWTDIGRKYWLQAHVNEKIDLQLAPAQQTLNKLLESGKAESFDFAFIDADKENYDCYYQRSLQLVRPGGLIAIDNVLWGGDVANFQVQNRSTRAIRALNEKLHHDERIALRGNINGECYYCKKNRLPFRRSKLIFSRRPV